MFLYGRNSVFERIKANPQSIKKVFLEDNFDVLEIERLIKRKKIPLIRLKEKEILRIKRQDNLQGIIAEVNQFEYLSLSALLRPSQNKQVSLIFLDNLTDPQNLGSIIRSLACLGGFGVVIPKYHSCDINETVLHVASGGENYVPVSMVANLSAALSEAKQAGYWICGAVVKEGEDISKVSLPFPLCLVLGSEAKGLRQGIENKLELKINLPMKGAALSFNVSVACAILCYEIARQRE